MFCLRASRQLLKNCLVDPNKKWRHMTHNAFFFNLISGKLFLIGENGDSVVNEASSEADLVRMEGETRCLTNSWCHEAFVALDCAYLSTIKTMDWNELTRTGKKIKINFLVQSKFAQLTMQWCQHSDELISMSRHNQLTSFVQKCDYECQIIWCHRWDWNREEVQTVDLEH